VIVEWNLDYADNSVKCPANYVLQSFIVNTKCGPERPGLGCIEGARCCALPHQGIAKVQDVWSILDKPDQLGSCESGYFMNGVRRSGCTNLYCLEELNCLKPNNLLSGLEGPSDFGECMDIPLEEKKWTEDKKLLNSPAWSTTDMGCPETHIMVGLKAKCNGVQDSIKCIAGFRCCKLSTSLVEYPVSTLAPLPEDNPASSAPPAKSGARISNLKWNLIIQFLAITLLYFFG
jgi:hypothetical protein